MTRWIKCQNQDWLNLDQVIMVFVDDRIDGEFKIIAETPRRLIDIAYYGTIEETYAEMDKLMSINDGQTDE